MAADPAAPTEVRLHDAGASVLVLWNAPGTDGVEAYTVLKGPDGEQAGKAGPDERSFEVTGLNPGEEYCFAVAASYERAESAASPEVCTSRGVKTPPSRVASPGLGAAPASPSGSSSPSASAARTTPPRKTEAPRATEAARSTRIVSPSDGSRVGWPFTARFTVSAADADADVISLSICIAGRCYLDGKLDISDGEAAPYSVRLGATKPEGVGVPWTLRLDRLSSGTYGNLVAERSTRIGNGTWGDKGSSMSSLNGSPITTLTVTKTG